MLYLKHTRLLLLSLFHTGLPESTDEAPLRWGEELNYCKDEVDINERDFITDEQLADIVNRINECGFVYFAPGLVKKEWVEKANKHLEKNWDDPKWVAKNAQSVPAKGRRFDTTVPLGEGPFNAFMYEAISTKIFGQVLPAIPGINGGVLNMNVVINALRPSSLEDKENKRIPREWIKDKSFLECWEKEQVWHDDSASHLLDGLNKKDLQLYLMFPLHDVASGPVKVIPGCTLERRRKANATDGKIPAECDVFAEEDLSHVGFAPEVYKAGSIMLHKPSLLHLGAKQTLHKNRFVVSWDIYGKGMDQRTRSELISVLGRSQHSKGEWHKINRQRSKYYDERLRKAIAEIKKLKKKAGQEL